MAIREDPAAAVFCMAAISAGSASPEGADPLEGVFAQPESTSVVRTSDAISFFMPNHRSREPDT